MLPLVKQGQAKILQKPSKTMPPVEVGRLGPSDYFGKIAYLNTPFVFTDVNHSVYVNS